jgi:hypothetical protein
MGSFGAALQRVLPCVDSPVRLSATKRERDGVEVSCARLPDARASTYRDPVDRDIEIAKPFRIGYT